MSNLVPESLHKLAQRHEDLTRRVLTRAATFNTKRLIIFLTPGYQCRAGGVMAISAYHRESLALRAIHRAKVIMCTVPGEPKLLKYTWFENDDYLLDLESVLRGCKQLDYLMLHMPAYSVDQVADWLAKSPPELLANIKDIHLNVLVQNIDNIRGKNISALKQFGRVTGTTSHEGYTTLTIREELGVPLHRLSVPNGPERYQPTGYENKDPLLIVSPDSHPLRDVVLQHLAQARPELTIRIIQDLDYEEYMRLTRRAKWSLTFGEGLDGYFVESAFTGGVPFAVFNSRFFTPPFASLKNVYDSWDSLVEHIATDIERLDEPAAYKKCWQETYDLLGELYSVERFRENLRLFYRGQYTFP